MFSAKSKKKAKHAAAQNLINQLRSLESFKFDMPFLNVAPYPVDDTNVTSSTTNGKKRKATGKSEPEVNYVGKLLEFCVKNKLPPASFDVIEPIEPVTNVQSHLREFFMKCRVNDVEKQGKGFNKKQAKQTAAMEVLTVLMKRQSEPNDISAMKLNETEPPVKRLKSVDKPQDTDASTSFENIVPEVENKGEHDGLQS